MKKIGCNELLLGGTFFPMLLRVSFLSDKIVPFFLPKIISLCFDEKTELESWIFIMNTCLLCQMISCWREQWQETKQERLQLFCDSQLAKPH